MPRNRSEKVPQLPEGIDSAFMPVIMADCAAHFRDGQTPNWIRSAALSNLGHIDGQGHFNDLSQDLKDAWNDPRVRAYMAVYLDFLYATQSK